MTVHDELIALCAEMHAAGERLTYNAILERRGGGSKRDIRKALQTWHAQRAHLLAEVALDMPEDVKEEAGAFGVRLWSQIVDRVAERIREMQTEADLSAYHAEQEIAQLHTLLSDSLNKIAQLESELARLSGGVS
ncbi:DNA-binding protein [Roseovarius sp.]|uniref:DNA-binding protein n=1 Tax=Roseovarius sp. TaxID=1486281 RepID=UPI0035673046